MKNATYFLICLLLFLACTKEKNNNTPKTAASDSLSYYFEWANSDSFPYKVKQIYTQRALAIVNKQVNDSMHRVFLLRVANRYYNMNDFKKYGKIVLQLKDEAQKAKDTFYMAKANDYLGDYYRKTGVVDSAYYYYFNAEKMFVRVNKPYNLARTRLNKAILLYYQDDYLASEIACFNALRAISQIEAIDLEFECLDLLGLNYNGLGDYEKALEYNIKAFNVIDYSVIPSWNQTRATSLNNLGFIFLSQKNYKEAIKCFEKALKEANLLKDNPSLFGILYDNLAYSKFKNKETKDVVRLFEQSLAIKLHLKEFKATVSTNTRLSEFYAWQRDTLKALEYCEKALFYANKLKNDQIKLFPLKQMALLNTKKALEYTDEYMRINDSLQINERNLRNKFTRIEYETDKIKTEYSTLEDKNRRLVIIFAIVTAMGILLYIIMSQKARNKELLYKQMQQEANEEIYNLLITQQDAIEINRVEEKKRVAQELHDGVLGRMFGIRMNLDVLNNFNDDLAIEQRKDYLKELKYIEQDIREISHDLNREKSELINNFVAIVNHLFEEQRKTFDSKLVSTIDATINWGAMPNLIKINLYRIIQESLHNCNKYAQASTIIVELKNDKGDLILLIQDDGQGFDPDAKKQGIGLKNMKARIDECKGSFDIKSKKEIGTLITVIIPLTNTF